MFLVFLSKKVPRSCSASSLGGCTLTATPNSAPRLKNSSKSRICAWINSSTNRNHHELTIQVSRIHRFASAGPLHRSPNLPVCTVSGIPGRAGHRLGGDVVQWWRDQSHWGAARPGKIRNQSGLIRLMNQAATENATFPGRG